MSDNLSQGTFQVIWDNIMEGSMDNELTMTTTSTCSTVTEMSSEEFLQQHGFSAELLFSDINSGDSPSPRQNTTPLPPPPVEDSRRTPSPNGTPMSDHQSTVTAPPAASAEFLDLSADGVRELIANEDNKNTMKKTLSDVKKFERFLLSKGEEREIHTIDHEQLDEYIANYILSVRKQNGEEYEPSTLRNMISSIDRKLKRQKYSHRVISEQSNAFQLSRDALRAKQKSLKRLGKGNKPNKSHPITDEEINTLFHKAILGTKTPKALLNTVWLHNCIGFGLRGTKENYDLRWGDVKLQTASDGTEYIELRERQTKTRTGENINNVREVSPKMYETPEDPERCPVNTYKTYASKRPKDFCEPDHPFYIATRTIANMDQNNWFMKITLGEKKLGSLLKTMAVDAGLDDNKRLTNHSTRKHLVQKLRDSGVAPTDIMQISGHKNIQSVMNYSAMSEQTHRQCSKILSNVRPRPAYTANSNSAQIATEPRPSTSYSDPSPRPSTSYSDPSPRPSTSYSDPSPRPSTSYSDPSPRPSTSYSDPSPRPSTSYSDPSPRPSTSYSDPSPRPSTSYSDPSPRPSTSYSDPSPRPSTSYSDPSPRPSTSYSDPSPRPSTSYSDPSPRPSTSYSDLSPRPSTSYSDPSPRPSTSYSDPSPRPSTSYSDPSPRPSTSYSDPSPRPSTSYSDPSPRPSTSYSDPSPRPSTSYSDPSPRPSTSYSDPSPRPSTSFSTSQVISEPNRDNGNKIQNLPHPQLGLPATANSSSNSISFLNDNVTVNTQMNSLFSGAILNIQNFHLHMK